MGASRRHRSPWLILIIVLLTSIAAPLNQFKVPPVLPLLMDAFHQPAGRAGLLMSVFAVTGLMLAIPGGFIFQRLGYRITGLVAILSILLGAGMGTLSGSMETMLASRWSWQGVWGFGFSDQGNIPTPRELTGSDLTKVLRNREL
jgi:predicted MFS family arabinose efflux permease